MLDTLNIFQSIFPILVILFSIIIHEVAHGYVAYILGDETAYRMGRLTLNPIPHIDIVGSILVPILSFTMSGMFLGWAKPVPVNIRNVEGKYGETFVSAAGVIANILLAILAMIFFKVFSVNGMLDMKLSSALFTIIGVNISLALFNLMPIPPFDGMSILQSLFPRLRNSFSNVVYNPVYLIIAIIVASTIFSYVAPFLFSVVMKILS